MKLSVDLSRLEEARKLMGAEKADLGPVRTPNERGRSSIEISLLRRGSVVISGAELERELHFPSGVAAIGETQVTLHIYQPHAAFEELSMRPAPKPRFHVADCKTLNSMRNAGRFDRYVATNEQTGRFRVQPKDPDTHTWGEELEASLAPCMNCLDHLNYDGFASLSRREKRTVVEKFDIHVFFRYLSIVVCQFTPRIISRREHTQRIGRTSPERCDSELGGRARRPNAV